MNDSGRRVRAILFTTFTLLTGASLAIYLIWQLRPLIMPVIIGILLAYLFRPLRSAFKYRWLPSSLRTALLFSIVSCFALGGFKFVKSSLPNDKEKLELLVRLKYKFNEKFERTMGIDATTGKGNSFYNLVAKDINPLRVSLNQSLELSSEQAEQFLKYREKVDGFEPVPDRYYQYFLENNNRKEILDSNTSASMAPAQDATNPEPSMLKTFLGLISMWVLMPIIFIFFLMDDGSISRFFITVIPNRYFELGLTVLEEVDSAIGKYLRGLSMECGLVAVTMASGLLLVGFSFQMALMIGLLTGLATSIPLVGPVVGISLSLTYALIAESIHPLFPFITMDNLFLCVLGVNAVVVALDNAVFQPIVLGSAVNLHPLVVILGIMAGSMMFGTAGVLLAIPTIVVSKAVIKSTHRGLIDYRII